MSETPPPVAPPQTEASLNDLRVMTLVCYVLFIAVFTNGITSVIGVVLAYIKRTDARGTIYESHFNNLIQVFWIGAAMFALFLVVLAFGAIRIIHEARTDAFPGVIFLVPVLWIVGVVYLVWYLFRTVKGLVQTIEAKPYR